MSIAVMRPYGGLKIGRPSIVGTALSRFDRPAYIIVASGPVAELIVWMSGNWCETA